MHFKTYSFLVKLDQWEQVLCIIYQYIAMLRKEGPKEWIFDECKVQKSLKLIAIRRLRHLI